MKFRKVISAWITVIALGVIPTLPAFQAEDTTKVVTKKAKRATKDATESSVAETATKGTSARVKTVPESEISAAKVSGKVWVNTDTGVYHKGGQWYGATKQGKFMTEEDAIKAGYHRAKTN